jgi:bacteriocin biosynthesis cyclodehydratase domain-containing protein
MVLRLDPRLSLVWISPDALQVGADRPHAVLPGVDRASGALLEALRIGTTRGGLDLLADRCSAAPGTVDALLTLLGPAVAETGGAGAAPTPRRLRVALPAVPEPLAPARAALRRTVAAGGAVLVRDRPDLAVLLTAHVVSPAVSARWLFRDVPHLPVVFGDEGVEVGPLVRPGAGPCLHCVARTRMDSSPAYAAIAAQLLAGTHPVASAASAPLVLSAAAELARTLAAIASGAPAAVDGASLRMEEDGLSVRRTPWQAHHECSCRALPGTATAPAESPGAAPERPRTAAATSAPA